MPFFGTNPFAMGAPRAGDEPLDRYGDLNRTSESGARRRRGRTAATRSTPTATHHGPGSGLKGAQLPVGGPKAGLGLMVDVLAGVLTGSNCSYEASMFSNTEGGPNVGQTIIAMDPTFIGERFVPHLETMFNALTEGNEVRILGERRGAEREA